MTPNERKLLEDYIKHVMFLFDTESDDWDNGQYLLGRVDSARDIYNLLLKGEDTDDA